MLLYVEGTDGTGKTTLVGQLATRVPFPVVDLNKLDEYASWGSLLPINTWVEDYYAAMFSVIYRGNAIYDRGPLSGIVYGDHLPREVEDGLLSLMTKVPCRVIILTANPEVIVERDPEWSGREDLLEEQTGEFLRLAEVCGELGIPTMSINTSNLSTQQVAYRACKELGVRF